MPVCHATLATSNQNYKDIQIWTEAEYPGLERCLGLSYVCHVNRHKVPTFLISLGPFHVYSTDSLTEAYFGESLLQYSQNTGLLTKTEGNDVYVVFYGDSIMSVWCFIVDFGYVNQIKNWIPKDSNDSIYFDRTTRPALTKSDISIFDRVLENKGIKKSTNKPQKNTLSNLVLSTNHQISQAVSKMVLSGLRLRGLSVNDNTPEKVAVREIYDMTRKAAMFSLRKFRYSFNGSKEESVRLEHIQDVVERLLEVFIDIESPRETLKSS